ncbi:T9SS type A sorting domain-containing protein [Sporocytophaga myxococcoides]|uniref:T9SS type A sorting domain-containing protein n=1 Tax=Sporocytophaga myxococcoides TaxID=153721 RepID=UPI00138B035E|nr:T9SS type A sorting domain-containing protein [Sporocytophaga myxococcoides]
MKPLDSCLRKIFLIFLIVILHDSHVFAQCASNVSNGTNLVKNYDFSGGFKDWTHDANYVEFTPCGSSCYSVPGRIYAGDKSTDFNSAFNMSAGVPIPDHTGTADNMMLMVDGICNPGVKLWQQNNIPIVPNTNYYFTVWITTLTATTPRGTLAFDINGANQPTTVTSVGAVGNWTKYTTTWYSGLTPPPTISISIENTTTTGCNSAVDFAIDDISFTPGCDFGTAGPIPNLGPDRTICGTGGSITLTPNFNAATQARPDVQYSWSFNGAAVPGKTGFGSTFYSLTATAPGTYAVCVDSAGSCVKSDVIVISNTYTIDLGPDIVLCSPASATLDAVYTGPGVTYQWYKEQNGTAGWQQADTIPGAKSKTYFANAAGLYRVEVTDPICGMKFDEINLTTNAATPNDGYYCPASKGGTGTANLSVSGPGKYKWWSAATAGTVLGKGATYTATGLTSPPTTHTYYVQDTTTFKTTAGPPAVGNGFIENGSVNAGGDEGLLIFNSLEDIVIDTITVLVNNYYCPTPGASNDNVIIEIRNSSGVHLPGSPVSVTKPCTFANNGGLPAPQMKVPLNIAVPKGTGYQMKLATGSGSSIVFFGNGTGASGAPPSPRLYNYPTSYGGVVEMVSNNPKSFNVYNKPDAFPGYFDWKITKGLNCDRVPVRATELCILPVEFLSVSAKGVKDAVQINWSTAWEVNSNVFIIQRSDDGLSFKDIGTEGAGGNTTSVTNYSFIDKKPGSSVAYYRIIEVDNDGSQTVSKIVAVNFENLFFAVYPNPAKDVLHIESQVEENQELVVSIQNSFGNIVYQNSGADLKSGDGLSVDVSGFPGGLYFVMIDSGNIQKIYKVVIE